MIFSAVILKIMLSLLIQHQEIIFAIQKVLKTCQYDANFALLRQKRMPTGIQFCFHPGHLDLLCGVTSTWHRVSCQLNHLSYPVY